MASFFAVPNEVLLSSLYSQFPTRDQQIRSLAILLSVSYAGVICTHERNLHREA